MAAASSRSLGLLRTCLLASLVSLALGATAGAQGAGSADPDPAEARMGWRLQQAIRSAEAPVFATPVFATPVFATPVFATPVFASQGVAAQGAGAQGAGVRGAGQQGQDVPADGAVGQAQDGSQEDDAPESEDPAAARGGVFGALSRDLSKLRRNSRFGVRIRRGKGGTMVGVHLGSGLIAAPYVQGAGTGESATIFAQRNSYRAVKVGEIRSFIGIYRMRDWEHVEPLPAPPRFFADVLDQGKLGDLCLVLGPKRARLSFLHEQRFRRQVGEAQRGVGGRGGPESRPRAPQTFAYGLADTESEAGSAVIASDGSLVGVLVRPDFRRESENEAGSSGKDREGFAMVLDAKTLWNLASRSARLFALRQVQAPLSLGVQLVPVARVRKLVGVEPRAKKADPDEADREKADPEKRDEKEPGPAKRQKQGGDARTPATDPSTGGSGANRNREPRGEAPTPELPEGVVSAGQEPEEEPKPSAETSRSGPEPATRDEKTGTPRSRPDASRAGGLQIQPVQGFLVTKVYAGSPADRAGVQRLDRWHHVNGKPLQSLDQILVLLQKLPKGGKLVVRFERRGKRSELEIWPD